MDNQLSSNQEPYPIDADDWTQISLLIYVSLSGLHSFWVAAPLGEYGAEAHILAGKIEAPAKY